MTRQSRPDTSADVVWQDYSLSIADRAGLMRQQPFVLWFTGLSGAGKTTVANCVARQLHDWGFHTYVLDGDNLRHGLNGDLGFSAGDRKENVRRLAHAASLTYDAGLITVAACISPFQEDRDSARSLLPEGKFIEVFVDTPLYLCEQRDNKGLYRRARAGEITEFTGIDSPYERPEDPEITIDTTDRSPSQCADTVLAFLRGRQLLRWPAPD